MSHLTDEIRRQQQAGVERAIELMRKDLTMSHGQAVLARAACFSQWHFIRIFTRLMGVTPGRYLAQLRMAEAARLLATTDLTVAYVAGAVGYSSVGTFSARFAVHHGCPPSVFRQRARANGEAAAC